MRILNFLFCLIFSIYCNIFLTSAFAGPLKSSSIEWTAIGSPGFIKINGEGGKATGSWDMKGDLGSGKFECELKTFSTGIEMRDEHMKGKYLDIKKYPKAILVIDPVKPSDDFEWTGKLTLKGITKPVKGHAGIKDGDVKADFAINLDDYPGVGAPSYMGITMAKIVDVRVSAKL